MTSEEKQVEATKVSEPTITVKDSDGTLAIKESKIDLGKALPLTLGDMRKLEKLGLLSNLGELKPNGMEDVAKVLHYLVSKIHPEIKLDDLDEVPLTRVTRAFLFVKKRIEEEEKDLDPTKSGS